MEPYVLMSHDCFHDRSSDYSFNKLNWLAAYPEGPKLIKLCPLAVGNIHLDGSSYHFLFGIGLPGRGVLFGQFQICFLDGAWKYTVFYLTTIWGGMIQFDLNFKWVYRVLRRGSNSLGILQVQTFGLLGS